LSGKSSLLRSWRDSFNSGSHGFESAGIRVVRALPPKDENAPSLHLGAQNSEFEQFRAQLFSPSPSETQAPKSYNFEITFDRRPSILAEIIDAAGELSVRSNSGALTVDKEAVMALGRSLAEAQNVIVAMPILDLRKTQDFDGIQELIGELTDTRGRDYPRRLVIAFTHYERLFYKFGSQAFRMAADPVEVRARIMSEIEKTSWYPQILEFARRPGREAFLTASGVYGFVAENGSVNIDPHRRPEESAEPLSPEQKDAARFVESGFFWDTGRAPLWRPFLTADPFFCALLGESGAYAIKLPGAPDPPPAAGAARTKEAAGARGSLVKSLFKKLLDSTNVKY
jgi:hypothetical protein